MRKTLRKPLDYFQVPALPTCTQTMAEHQGLMQIKDFQLTNLIKVVNTVLKWGFNQMTIWPLESNNLLKQL